MTEKEKVKFVASFLKEVASLDICNYYGYADEIRDLFFEGDKLRVELKNAKSWQLFIFEMEEALGSFIYEQEIIGYKVACNFLSKFDPSFRISLEEAEAEDRPLSALSSEDLAGLALRSILKNELYNIVRTLRKEEASK